MTYTKVINRQTGEICFADYTANRLGNMRFCVVDIEHQSGKFYTDKEFDKKFKIVELVKI
jgi:hypothetical protein